MGLNRDYIGKEFPPQEHVVKAEEIAAYALAIGSRNASFFGTNGYDSGLSVMAPPSYTVTYELPLLEKVWADPGLNGGEEQAKQNVLMLVHGDQNMKFYKPVKPGDKIVFTAKIDDIEDKGSGELLKLSVLSKDEKGEKVAESHWGLFIRGIGSGEKPKSSAPKAAPAAPPEPPPLAFRDVIRVPEDVTYKYADASNDHNPIHVNEQVAREAGLKGIIVHGLCTMSMTMKSIIESYLDADPGKLKALGVRFTAPVYPGDTLIVDGWETGEKNGNSSIAFEVTRESDGVKVIKGGTAEAAL
ncbi:MAG: MaoC family dehydratase N-terminal domain-containing protein [Candidatus Dadabacteria bacterium]|nr:MaoC family dehydratase N-terminal domain-containing protein [Candidatus Dadabacteria bacterium]